MLDDIKNGTRIATVIATIRQRIAGRSLTAGDKLPSIRALARSLQLSTSTVVEAYDRLAAEGVIQARAGSGFYVASQAAPLALSEIGPKLDRAVDSLLGLAAIAGSGERRSEAWMRLAAALLASGRRHAPSPADVIAHRGCVACRLRHAARPAAVAPADRAADGRARHRRIAGPDHADRIGHAGARSPVPVSA